MPRLYHCTGYIEKQKKKIILFSIKTFVNTLETKVLIRGFIKLCLIKMKGRTSFITIMALQLYVTA